MPPKPRVQTPKRPKQRRGSPAAGDTRRQRQLLYGIAGTGIVALGAVVLLLVLTGAGGGTDPARVRAAADAAGCTFQAGKAQVRAHSVTSPDGTAKWKTNPPTTGPHYEVPAVWGAYSDPLQPARVVHNLEHGGIAIQYGDEVPDATVAQLRSFYDDHQRGTLLAPFPSLDEEIAVGAWVTPSDTRPDDGTSYLMKCTRFAPDAFAAFFDEFQFKGPERYPGDTLLPGT